MQRRTHHKSRLGCSNCKRRHIKCDLLGPPCANCQVRSLDCTLFPTVATAPTESPRTITPKPTGTNTNSSVIVGNRILELELLHRWSTDTYRSFHVAEDDWAAWQQLVPQDALKCDWLLNAIFAIAAIHIATDATPTLARDYHVAALEYHGLAISAFQSIDCRVTVNNHLSVFAFSNIILALAVVDSLLVFQPDGKQSIVRSLVTAFQLVQGVSSIWTTARTWLGNGPFRSLTHRNANSQVSGGLDVETEAAISFLRETNDDSFNQASIQSPGLVFEAVRRHEQNTDSVTELQRSFILTSAGDTSAPMRWLAKLKHGFAQSLSEEDPLSMLITLHWAILLHRFGEETWWAKSSGKLLASELCALLMPQKPEWQKQMSWVRQQVGLPAIT